MSDDVAVGDGGTAEVGRQQPTLVATDVDYCIVHRALDHGDKAWTACRFRQLFYFENPMDEHTLMWSDEIAAARGDQP